MAHCAKCGSEIDPSASFCPKCGSTQKSGISAPPSSDPPTPAKPLPNENITGLLCYVVGWITGLIFFFTDKRPFVRFHATQSIVVFGGLNIVQYVIVISFGLRMFSMPIAGFSLVVLFLRIIELLVFVLWIFCMFKAYQGARFRIPVAADIAERIFGKL